MRPHRSHRFAAVLLVAASTLSWNTARAQVPAQVQAPSEAGAKTLAAALSDGLKRWFPPQDGTTVSWKALQVVPSGDHYAVTIPELTVKDAEGSGIWFGTVSMTVAPREGATYAVSATLPDSIPILDKGKTEATIRLGRQRFDGLWSGGFETFLSLDADYGDLSVTGAKNDGVLRIGAVTAMSALKPDAAGAPTWSGPGALAVSKVTVTDESKRELMSLDGLALEGTYSRVDLARVNAFQTFAQRQAAAGTEPPPAETLSALRGLLGGASVRMRMSGLSTFEPESGTRIALGLLSAGGGVEDLDQPLGGLSLGLEASGFSMSPAVAPTGFEPRSLQLQLGIAKLPSPALWRTIADLSALSDTLEEGEADPRQEAAMQRLMGALSQAGTELRLDKVAMDSPALSGSLSGAFRATATAAQGAVGGMTVLLRGLDGAARALQPASGKPDEETAGLLAGLAMVQAMGQPGKDDAGNETRSYKIDMTEDGRFLLNGTDMGPLLAGMGGSDEPEELDGGEYEEEEIEEQPLKKAKKN
ncbi:hypothetical protein [Azospirillum sp. SYSU D00513]|uniref:hypothetical protein n=1 Tax=Azospirillum sp. SYSU D00513 TaxID=2812561 RepID=UPI001A970CB9|nr:hypothetical protein [Azospirillum sp. SYSU D00513]